MILIWIKLKLTIILLLNMSIISRSFFFQLGVIILLNLLLIFQQNIILGLQKRQAKTNDMKVVFAFEEFVQEEKIQIYDVLFELLNYMFNRSVSDPYGVPLEESRRSSTDVCCTIVAAMLALALFGVAVVNFNRDSTNTIYFSNWGGQEGITEADYYGFKATLLFTFIITLCLGTIWVVFVQFFPSVAPITTYAVGALLSLFIGVAAFFISNTVFDGNIGFRLLLGAMGILIGGMLIASLCCYSQELQFQSILLKYSVRFLFISPHNFLYVLLFLVLYCGLIVLFLFQHVCFSNITHNNFIFFDFGNPDFLAILNIIEFLWGLQFLRDAFIFVTSGNAVEWYWCGSQDDEALPSFDRLINKNWGSVVAGSFVNAFFRIPANLIEVLVCYPNSYCSQCGQSCSNNCNWCLSLLELIRTDSYSYINIFGTPYCDAGRECEKLCSASHHFIGYQSAMRNFRMAAGVVLVALSLILGHLILSVRVQKVSVWMEIDLIVLIIGSMSFFASTHPSVAEGIQTSFLVECYLSSGYDYMQKCIPSFRRELQALETKSKDGHWH